MERPADQSSSGARASCSGMDRVRMGGIDAPRYSPTSRDLKSFIERPAFSASSACARR
jgi:hypothetical protein